MAQAAAERIACAQAVDHVDFVGRHRHRRVLRLAEDTARTLFDDGQLDTEVEQRVGGLVRVGLADGDLTLLTVADRDRDMGQRLAHLLGGRGGEAQNIGR